MAWGAAFYVARRIARSRRNRRFALDAVGAAGLAVTLLFTILWGAVLARWFAVDASVPPLPLAFPTLVFRHVHVVGFTILMLAPAMSRLWRIRMARPVIGVGYLGAVCILIASGSRTAWVAAVIASVVAIAAAMRGNELAAIPRRLLASAGIAGAGLAIVAVQTGMATSLWDRLTTLRTLGARGEIWSAALTFGRTSFDWHRDGHLRPGSSTERLLRDECLCATTCGQRPDPVALRIRGNWARGRGRIGGYRRTRCGAVRTSDRRLGGGVLPSLTGDGQPNRYPRPCGRLSDLGGDDRASIRSSPRPANEGHDRRRIRADDGGYRRVRFNLGRSLYA